jgi:hypothetical protein
MIQLLEFIMNLKSRTPSAGALLRPSFLAASLFVSVSSAALALDTAYGQNTHNFKEQAQVAQQRLEQAGYSEIADLQLRKHGFTARAIKDGKPVKVEITERDGIMQQ